MGPLATCRVRLRGRPVVLAVVLSLALISVYAAACGGGDESATTESSGAASSSTSTTAGPSGSTTIPMASTTSTTAPSGLPGEPMDLGFPKAGDVLSVVGVAHDDHLNVRAAPGTDQAVLVEVAPTADDLVATGAVRKLATSIWYEVQTKGVTGWVGSYYVAYAGAVDDLTSQIVQKLGGSIPSAETMLELGLIVAKSMATEEPRSRIVVSVAPTVGDLGEVTYDVVDVGDDSVRGYRLHVFGQPIGSSDGFSLKSVEATFLCGRGVGPDGTCL